MPIATAPAPVPRRHAPHENWKPPAVGICLLLPVGARCLAIADLQGILTLPVGTVNKGQTLEQASHAVLPGLQSHRLNLRHVAVHEVQARRKKVVTHVLAARAVTHDTVTTLRYRDPRAVLKVMPTLQFLDHTSPRTRARTLSALQALATGTPAHLIEHTVTTPRPPCPPHPQTPSAQDVMSDPFCPTTPA
ncbi:hypothetical protein SAMN05428941_0062 [Streptomyces sp. 2114.2]|nr:hypothetical protein BX268_0058 [Streptomyces sp. 2221.1]SDS21402.1 hypothetical protein SAMN05428941_0062 [Streptomyces sp. 2114.2]